MLELRLLGKPTVFVAGAPVTGFVSDKALALLAYLARQHGAHARETLAALLWGELDDAHARANLRVVLHNLRQLCPGYLDVTRKDVTFLHHQPHHLDVNTFEQLAEQRDDAVALAQAAALYQGDFLSGLMLDGQASFQAWWRTEQERLRLLALQVLDQLAHHLATTGAWAEAEQVTRRLLALEPWREASQRQLMLLLARQGRTNAALAQYEECCRILAAELDVEPMPETVALQRRIRKLRTRPRHNLPTEMLPLLGRKEDLSQIGAYLSDPSVRLLTITGLGGVGKTHLAIEVARRNQPFWLDGVCWVPLAGVQEATNLAGKLLDALNVENVTDQAPRTRLLDFLREKEMLLVLDNFEHLLEAADLLREIVRAAPDVKLLVTSREIIGLRVEQLYPLGGLTFSAWTTPVEAACEPAVQCFLHHAKRVRPAFTLRRADLAPLQQILRLTEGMPLALILAATWVEVLSPAEIAAEVGRSLGFLQSMHRDVPARQQSMRAVFASTWARLSGREQQLFAALALFRGGFSLAAAQSVSAAAPPDLLRLANRSLLVRRAHRFEIHELLRQFAAERLEEAGRGTAIGDTHSAYYLAGLAQRLPDLKGRDQLAALDAITVDLDNIRTGWRWACVHGRWAQMVEASQSLYLFALIRSRYMDGAELLALASRAIHPAARELAAVRSCASAGRAALLARSGAHEEALSYLPELQSLIKQSDRPEIVAFCQVALSLVLNYGRHYPEAISVAREARGYFEEVGDHFYAVLAALWEETALMWNGEPWKALRLSQQSLPLAEQAGDLYARANLSKAVGALLWMIAEGPSERAEYYFREAANLRLELGEKVEYADVLAQVANMPLWRNGDTTRARPQLAEALAIANEQHITPIRLHVLAELTTLRLVEGDYAQALALTEEILASPKIHPGTRCWSSIQRGIALLAVDRFTEAIPTLQWGLARMVELDWPTLLSTFLPFYGMLLARRGDEEWAVRLLARGFAQPNAAGRLEIDPLIQRFRAEMEAALGPDQFARAWEQGKIMDAKEEALKVLATLPVAS